MKRFGPNESRVLVALLVLIALMETGARLFETRLSKDVGHIRSLPQVAARLRAAPPARFKVLILGNSLSRDGFDLSLLRPALARLSGREVELAAMHPDGSSIAEWYYGYRRYFDQAGARPDLVLIGTGRGHLLDPALEPDRLAAFYASGRDFSDLLQRLDGGVESAAKAVCARASMLFAHRNRVQPLLFYNFVPGYTETASAISVQRPVPAAGQGASPADGEAGLFTALLDTLRAAGTRVVVAAIPVPAAYELPETVLRQAAARQVPVIREGSRLAIDVRHFPDGYHLDADGSAQFTRMLLQQLQAQPALFPSSRP